MTYVADALRWWLVILAIGLISFPLVSRICSRLPDRGYSISKILGILVVTWVAWIISSMHLLKFSYLSIIAALLILFVASLYLGRKNLRIREWPLKQMVVSETIFIVAFGLFLFFLSHRPDFSLTYSEDFMDFGFLKAVLRTDYFPPTDPWMSGQSLPYYYGGHLATAIVVRLSAVPATIGYHLAVAMFFGLAVASTFGLGYGLTRKRLYGVVAVVFVLLAGFISGAFQLAAWGVQDKVAGYTPLAASGLIQWLQGFDFVSNNWVIQNAVTHYPYYAFLVGDLHSNIMSIPFQIAFITLLFAFFVRGEGANKDLSRSDVLIGLAVLGLSLGFMVFIYSWLYPACLLLTGLAFVLLKGKAGMKGVVAVIGLSFVLYLPYYVMGKTTGGIQGIGLVPTRTTLPEFGEVFALFLFVIFSLFVGMSWRYGLFKGKRLVLLIAGTGAAVLIAFLLHFQLVFVLAPLVLLPLYNIWKASPKKETQFVFVVMLTGVLTVLFVEFFYLRDMLGHPYERYNTILKLYVPVWVFMGLASAFALFLVLDRLKGKAKAAWTSVFVVFLVAALIHPVASTTSWASGDYSYTGGKLTLDPMGFVKTTNAADHRAVEWINTNISGAPVILEAPGEVYKYSSRVSAFTGLPTLIGWGGWEVMWRGSWDQITERSQAADRIYRTTDNASAAALLEKYSVEYVYLGSLETERYGADALRKFSEHTESYEQVYADGGVRIYRVLP